MEFRGVNKIFSGVLLICNRSSSEIAHEKAAHLYSSVHVREHLPLSRVKDFHGFDSSSAPEIKQIAIKAVKPAQMSQ